MSNSASNIIDLTDEDVTTANIRYATTSPSVASPPPPRAQRLPRFDRNIIDLSVDTSPPPSGDERETRQRGEQDEMELDVGEHGRARTSARRLPLSHMASRNSPRRQSRGSSSEVEFVSERPLSQLRTRPSTPSHDAEQVPLLDLTAENDDDDEVEYVRTAGRVGINLQPPLRTARVGAEMRDIMDEIDATAINNSDPNIILRRIRNMFPEYGADPGRHARNPRHFQPPGPMDFQMVAFDMHMGREPATAPSVAPPKYDPPPSPGAGFTRSPAEDEVVVCPNCGDELAVGDTEAKKQVWIVKPCGHVSYNLLLVVRGLLMWSLQVYCGHCMLNRQKKPKSNKGKARETEPLPSRPFNQCKVDGCASKVNSKTVLQIFL